MSSRFGWDDGEVEWEGDKVRLREGGVGSGNWGHAGRPGSVGGSAPGSGQAKPFPHKTLILNLGGSGSGKGANTRMYVKRYGATVIDSDEIKKSMPMYIDDNHPHLDWSEDLRKNGPSGPHSTQEFQMYPPDEQQRMLDFIKENTPFETPQQFANYWLPKDNPDGLGNNFSGGLTHEVSSYIAKMQLQNAIDHGTSNFVYDATGNKQYVNAVDGVPAWADQARANGYDVIFHWANTPVGAALVRNEDRPRSVAPEVLLSSHAKVAGLVPQVRDYVIRTKNDYPRGEAGQVRFRESHNYRQSHIERARRRGYI